MDATATSVAVGGAILAGGASTRMGTSKALIRIDGSTMIERCALALEQADVFPVVVIGGPLDGLEQIGLRQIADVWPGEGPLGGTIVALRAAVTELVVVVSCDLLHPSSQAMSSAVEAVEGYDLAVPLAADRPQWLHSAWRRDVLDSITNEFEGGARSIRSGISGLDVNFFDGGDPASYLDADYPSDLPRTSTPNRGMGSASVERNH